ncbi:MAG: trypsin-like peptidase domain-containing protein, partial [Alphaproteobacteria bacterium]|nr:trypsin-like peptidase domain-containing protein [Alphaproteobacteria bacterium]
MLKSVHPFLLAVLLAIIAVPVSAQVKEAPESKAQAVLSFAPIVKKASPAVVNIYTRKLVKQRVISPLMGDPFFQQFFGGAMPHGMTRQRMENSLGSGVIVRSDGLIVTNNHVIEGADQITVVLHDRHEYEAKLLTADEHSDLAVLRIEAKDKALPFLELADSDAAEVGDMVLAIGNPFGVGQTVTNGIISAMARTAVDINDINYF